MPPMTKLFCTGVEYDENIKTYQKLSIGVRLAGAQTSDLVGILLARWILMHIDLNKQRLYTSRRENERFTKSETVI